MHICMWCIYHVLFVSILHLETLLQQDGLQVNPSDVIILEGILIFHEPRVRELMNMKIFVDTGHLFCIYNFVSDFLALYHCWYKSIA